MSTTRHQRDTGVREESFGPYLVYERLGVGGMATVHRARERGIEGFERIVALKRLLPHMAEDESFVRAFVREAKLASMLQHANIVQIYELGRVGTEYFISMEYIEGRDVRKVLRQARKVTGPPPIPVVVGILLQVCEALDYAHSRLDDDGQPLGLVHRDVSPSNLLITRSGHLKVIDFGIAKAQSLHLRTHTGRVKGKLAYMSPEGTRGLPVDHRSDVFSVGVICHELLTARPLFATRNDYQTLMRVQSHEVAPPSTFNQRCPPELDAITLKALAKNADERWQSAGEMRDALDAMRAQYGMEATHREVATWTQWAFAQEEPPSFGHSTASSSGISSSHSRSPSTDPAQFSPLTPVRVNFTATPRPRSPEQILAHAAPIEADEDIIEIAWGGRDDDAAPVLLDDVPDVSEKVPAPGAFTANRTPVPDRLPTGPQSWARGSEQRRAITTGDLGPATPTTARPRPRPTTEFGAAIVEREQRGRGLRLALAAIAVLSVAAVALLATRGRGGTTAVAPIDAATLKLVVEPADALITIDGREHAGSPFTTELAPGHYQIEVRRDGYESWVSSIDIAARELQTVRVALQPGASTTARLAMRSDPAGLEVVIDGKPVEGTTPLSVEVGPGAHLVELHTRYGKVWEHRFEASANTQYELHPMLDEEIKRQKRHRERDRERERERERREASESSATSVQLDPADPRGDRTPTRRAAPAGLTALPIAPDAPPVVTQAPRRTEPVVIPPHQARKVSGSIPALRRRPGAETVSRVSVKLCIDTAGAVTSVAFLTKVPDDLGTTLERALRGWKYRPHRETDRPTPACFVHTFRVE